MTKKEVLRCIAFGLLLCVVLVMLCGLFENKNNSNWEKRLSAYKEYPKDTVDAIYVGTSGADRYWIGAKAYQDYGMTVYPISTDGLPAWLYTNAMEFALLTQDPELVILDMRSFADQSSPDDMDVCARRFLDALDFGSPLWFRTALKSMEKIHEVDNTKSRLDLSFLLSFIRFHPQWAEDDYLFSNQIGDKPSPYNGFFMNSSLTAFPEPIDPIQHDNTITQELTPLCEEALYEIIDFAQEHDLEILFVDSPKIQTEIDAGCSNYLYDLLDAKGIPYVTFYDTSVPVGGCTLDFDYEKDFYNEGHVNFYGAVKYTDALAAYLNENYNLPDRRGEEATDAIWSGTYEKILKTVASYEED